MQERQAELIASFAEDHPELQEALEIFGVAEDVLVAASTAARPAVTSAANTRVA